jgi:hypothetical protein
LRICQLDNNRASSAALAALFEIIQNREGRSAALQVGSQYINTALRCHTFMSN